MAPFVLTALVYGVAAYSAENLVVGALAVVILLLSLIFHRVYEIARHVEGDA